MEGRGAQSRAGGNELPPGSPGARFTPLVSRGVTNLHGCSPLLCTLLCTPTRGVKMPRAHHPTSPTAGLRPTGVSPARAVTQQRQNRPRGPGREGRAWRGARCSLRTRRDTRTELNFATVTWPPPSKGVRTVSPFPDKCLILCCCRHSMKLCCSSEPPPQFSKSL